MCETLVNNNFKDEDLVIHQALSYYDNISKKIKNPLYDFIRGVLLYKKLNHSTLAYEFIERSFRETRQNEKMYLISQRAQKYLDELDRDFKIKP